ncbi:MAG: iron-containing redox enzyme family protein, partial [Janthinobacterium lividum]
NTIPSIAHVVKAAALEGDMENLALAGKNLYEETGQGNQDNVHIKLLIDAYNIHAKDIFSLDSMDLNNISHSTELIPEVELFLENQRSLYEHNIYNVVIGANYAQETAASSMLENFYNAFFLKYKSRISDINFAVISKYFCEHLNGTEEQHALNAQKIIINRCSEHKNIPHILFGVEQFLNAQSKLWDGLHRELLATENEELIINFSVN